MVTEDMNNVRYIDVDVSNLVSVEGNDGSVADFSVCNNSEGNSTNS